MNPRRRFDHLHVELSVSVGRRISRFALWQQLQGVGCDPESLTAGDATGFCRDSVDPFLAKQGLVLEHRARKRLLRSVGRFDPRQLTPYERMARWGEPTHGSA